ncbi:Lipoprotein signal peptidase [Rhodoluna lacicola]|uniref:Lipoprotein signal peptidase n=1 Tax=Rhodoluna lacicola TaxID=529884 RepID=A0A060JM76_9MICO|nr:Lipoprotein signal peptidase [Rhodoluna lacicola]
MIWFFACAFTVIALDQFLKNYLILKLEEGAPIDFIGSMVRLNLVYNDSAAFSIGFGATWIFTIISSVAVLVLLWFSRKIETTGWAIMAGVLLGGVSGNLIDRYLREPGFAIGHVVDYIQIPLNFPIFNVADMAIFFICSISVIRVLRGDQIGRKRVSE